MLHVFTLLSVPEYSADALVRSIRHGGEWHSIARHLLPELIATDLLEHCASDMPPFLSSSRRLYLAQDFWTSSDAYLRNLKSQNCQALFLMRRQMTTASFELGTFEFPSATESDVLSHRPIEILY